MDGKKYLSVAILETLLVEAKVPKDPKINQLVKDPVIQKFISLSKKAVNVPLTPNEKTEVDNLLKDPKVHAYLKASEKVGQRIGWVKGGVIGSLGGGVTGASGALAAGVTSGLGVFALALLGAIAGGLSLGYVSSKIQGILRRWKTEEEITKGGLAGGAIVNM
jgi:hypothetical protein